VVICGEWVAKKKKKKKRSVVTTGKLRKLSVESASLIELGRIHEKVDNIQKDIQKIDEELSSHGKRIKEIYAGIDLFLSSEKHMTETERKGGRKFIDVDLKILDIIKAEGPMSAAELSERCGFRDRSSFQKRYIRPMVRKKILSSVKRGRNVVYEMRR